jgi:CheY-like chemotaxis protein
VTVTPSMQPRAEKTRKNNVKTPDRPGDTLCFPPARSLRRRDDEAGDRNAVIYTLRQRLAFAIRIHGARVIQGLQMPGHGCLAGAITTTPMGFMDKKIFTVLMVDDSDDDRFFLRLALEGFPRLRLIHELHDGEQAILYLSGTGPFADRHKHPLPDLMLLDLKMPRKTGFEVLAWLRNHPLPTLTVIVLSGSHLGDDIGASIALGAHGFWTKTAVGEKLRTILQEIEEILDNRWWVRDRSSRSKRG